MSLILQMVGRDLVSHGFKIQTGNTPERPERVLLDYKIVTEVQPPDFNIYYNVIPVFADGGYSLGSARKRVLFS